VSAEEAIGRTTARRGLFGFQGESAAHNGGWLKEGNGAKAGETA